MEFVLSYNKLHYNQYTFRISGKVLVLSYSIESCKWRPNKGMQREAATMRLGVLNWIWQRVTVDMSSNIRRRIRKNKYVKLCRHKISDGSEGLTIM